MSKILRRSIALGIRGYQLVVSPWLGPRCRYLPSCSEYALTSVQRFGVLRGGRMAIGRFCRCHPWGGSGLDEVPPAEESRYPKGGIRHGSMGH